LAVLAGRRMSGSLFSSEATMATPERLPSQRSSALLE